MQSVMFGNRRHFRELLTRSEERIASNILADRLTRLEKAARKSLRTEARAAGPGASVLSWHVRGSVTSLETGQRYRLVITIRQTHRPDGTLRGNRSDIKLIPVTQ